MCEFCGNDKDIIFPFQLNKCQRCQGEHAAGLAGLRAPSPPRASVPLPWRDWKIPKPRRLAALLSQDRAEGEGGEEVMESAENTGVSNQKILPLDDEREASGEEEEDDWEVVGLSVEEEEGCDKAEADEGQRKSRHGALTRRARQGKLNLLKSLHINRLKKGVSAGEGGNSAEDQEEKKHLWRITKLPGLGRGLSKEHKETGAKTEGEGVALETEAGSQEEDRIPETEEEEDSDRSQPGETGSKGSLKIAKVFQPHLLAIGRRGRSKVDSEVTAEEEVVAVEEERHTTIPAHQGSWRARKTRRARRLTRGRKVQDEGEAGSDREDGDREKEAQAEREV